MNSPQTPLAAPLPGRLTVAECVGCGKPFNLTRSDKRYCTSRCRSLVYKARRRAEEEVTHG